MQISENRIKEEGLVRIQDNGREWLLLGTAHVSQRSSEQVSELLEKETPDAVCLELDEQRRNMLLGEQRWQHLDIFRVIKEKKAGLLVVSLLLSNFQRRIGSQVGSKPGQEMLTALELAKKKELRVELIDRPVGLTLKRVWRNCSFWQKNKLLLSLWGAAFSDEKVSATEIEELKKEDMLEQLSNEFSQQLPHVKEVLLDERDRYLANSLVAVPGKKIFAVVGAGHLRGILEEMPKLLEEPAPKLAENLASLSKIEKKSIFSRIFPWLMTLALLTLIGWGFFSEDHALAYTNLKTWLAVNIIFTFVALLPTLPHPLTLFGASLAAPLTSLVPFIGAGMVGALIQAVLCKPCVNDVEQLHTHLAQFRNWYKNRICRVLLVLFGASFGSAIGTYLASYLIANRIF